MSGQLPDGRRRASPTTVEGATCDRLFVQRRRVEYVSANNGAAYPAKGVDVKEGATVKVYAEKASAHAEIAIQVPKEDEDTGGKGKSGDDDENNQRGHQSLLWVEHLILTVTRLGSRRKLVNG